MQGGMHKRTRTVLTGADQCMSGPCPDAPCSCLAAQARAEAGSERKGSVTNPLYDMNDTEVRVM